MPPLDPNMQPPGAPPVEPPPGDTGEGLVPESAGAEPGLPQAVTDQDEQITQASPQEQAQHDQFVGRAWQLIYSDQLWPQILQMLEGGAGQDEQGNSSDGDPVNGLATATEMVVAQVGQKAEDAGEQLQPDVVYHAAADILEELAEVSRRGKIKDYSKDQDALEKAWFMALDMFRERLDGAGVIDQGHAQQDLSRLVKMDQNGTLDKIMRDLAANDHAGTAGEPGPNAPEGFQSKGFGTAMGAEAPAVET